MNKHFDPKKKSNILITCLPGLGEVLGGEVESRAKQVHNMSKKHVVTTGNFYDTYALNYQLRTASHVHYLLTEFKATDAQELYRNAAAFSWEDILDPTGYFSIHSVVNNDTIRDNRFANLKLKDAIADRFTKKFGKRPNSGSENHGIGIYLHWSGNNVTIYLDSSGESLSRRGYRRDPWKAPLAESLAAAIMLSTNWDGESAILNPMGGSGTLLIEALMIARKIPPGSFRKNFGLKAVRGFDESLWNSLKVSEKDYPRVNFPVIYNDNKKFAHKALSRNLAAVGMEKIVRTHLGDFQKMRIPEGPGIVIFNPPYGERLGEVAELQDTYQKIGDFFKQKCVNYTGYVFTANRELAKNLGLRATSRKPFFNGKLEARLMEYPLYKGTRKKDNADTTQENSQ